MKTNHETTENESAQNRMSSAVERAGHYVDSATSQVGSGIDQAAQRAASRAQRAAERLSRAGRYLEESSPRQIGRDVTDFVRAHPKASMALSVGVGFLLMRMFMRRK